MKHEKSWGCSRIYFSFPIFKNGSLCVPVALSFWFTVCGLLFNPLCSSNVRLAVQPSQGLNLQGQAQAHGHTSLHRAEFKIQDQESLQIGCYSFNFRLLGSTASQFLPKHNRFNVSYLQLNAIRLCTYGHTQLNKGACYIYITLPNKCLCANRRRV